MALYGLCILFRRNAIVHNNGRVWTTMDVPAGTSQNVVEEMCECRFLYLGNNLYALLKRRPFTLTKPVETVLDDWHNMRPLYRNKADHTVYLELIVNGEFERCIQDDEIDKLVEQKPELLPEEQTLDVFDVDYIPPTVPDLTLVKSEPEDTTNSQIVGHIINQPANVARTIKQELINNAVQSVVECHSSECELSQYVQSQGAAGLHIEDVRSLISADQMA